MDAAHDTRHGLPSGTSRLMEHCEALARVMAFERSNARSRLEIALGSELATRLVVALAPAGRRGGVAML